MNETEIKDCIGCGREFAVLDLDTKPLYCTPDCEEQHSIFEQN